ncbi:hypothetical protein B5E64_15175 [Drancourtella sp. An12]|uniref:Stk1 family PASTA domain-containing Ser/Thr kinase n=1 Tax=Drancourtella sp. An12 TaxID=1965548 RepID=UPI000B3A26CE|nr:Stk1 family PASTA domain-containing Ser/Thr kinase [Drancourtella sp. An12]OUQ43343.1 hypothetical protein B5E64_15175 [Drancourtella sp. An12]
MVKDGIVLGERYEILSKIGAGGMADVYKGRDNVLNRYVAVKVLKKEYREDETYVKKFRSEAQAAAGIMNPNIVNVYDVGVDRGLYYMVMELVEGITLKEYIAKKEKLTPKEVISITLQVCAGMEAVHKGHIIHRDIKPQNIIISNEGKVKVTDFGIAKAASSNTTSSNAMGSVHYTSPEQARGGFSDEKSDIYSIGITMYEMVTGRVPFDGDSTVAIAMKHLQEEIVPPSEYVPMPYSLEQIILKCTQKNPDLRYPNVTLLAQDLRRSLSDPNGDFVKNGAAAYDAGADTVMISESDRRKLQNQYDDEYDDDDRYDDEYDDGYDDDYDDGYDDDDYDTRNLKTHRNKEEHTGKKPKMSNMMKIIIALVAVLVVCAAAYGIGSAVGLFGGGSGSQEEEEVRMADVPNLANLGLTEDQAREAAEKAGFKLEVSGTEASDQDEGTVIDQDPEYGEEAERGSTINVVLSAGPSTVTVPDVTGDDVSTATEKIEAEGLSVGSTSEEYSDEYDEGEVIRTTPSSGSEVEEGSTVNLVVSQGVNPEDEMVTVQSFVGMPERNLTSWAEDNEINVSRSEDYSDDVGIGRIISQSLTSGTVAKGTTISYVVSLGGEPDEEEPSDSSNNNDNNSSDNTNNGGSDSSSGNDSGSSTSSDGPVWESNIQSWVQENGNPKYNVEYEENSSVSRGQVIRYEQNSDGSYTFYVSLG